MTSGPPNSDLETWQVIETWDSEVPDGILAVMKKDQCNDRTGYVYKLMWLHTFDLRGGWERRHDSPHDEAIKAEAP